MAYAGVQMFMEKLKPLINSNDNPFINNPAIICERPQFQLLYDELDNPIIQTLFIHQHQDLEKVNDLKKRFTYAAEAAQYIVDLFLSRVHIRNNGHSPTSDEINPSLNLDGVWRSFNLVKVELTSMKMDSSRRRNNQSAAAPVSLTRNSQGSRKLMDEIVVGLDRDFELIRDKLVEDQKKVDVVSIVGMGGIGKTTLATKVFNDGYVKHHFHFRVWVTVSQTYDKRDVLIQILESIRGQLHLEKASEMVQQQLDIGEATDSQLRETVHKHLMGQRYLIVIDDIWNKETWDNLKIFFPHDNTRSRILLTSRLTEVAKHANSYGFIHKLQYLNKERSWELLCQKVFHGNQCPEWSIKPGMQIVESCQGLPLAVVVIAGVLAKEAWSEKFWVEIAERAGSYIVGDHNGCIETLGLSYNHLPLHLRECFLYLGGFSDDYKFEVRRLIWLWVAEGFIEQVGNRSLGDIAEGYLMDLIDRNLVIVAHESKFNGAVKAFKVHDLVRELCLRKAKEEGFILQTERLIRSNVITSPYTPVRMFIDNDIKILGFPYPRSVLEFRYFISFRKHIAKYFGSFALLRVLDLQRCRLKDFPKGMELLVHLRYLAIWNESSSFPSSICNLWNLQTLIYLTEETSIALPSNISDLVNLRHLWSCYPSIRHFKKPFLLPSIEKPMNLQTVSGICLEDGIHNLPKWFPYLKELTCTTHEDEDNDLKSLTYLEKLHLTAFASRGGSPRNITFPATLKTLTLDNFGLSWSDMSIIQSLPNLQVLKLHYMSFEGSYWNTDEQEFRQLKFLRLALLKIKQWEAYSTSFPCLEQLQVRECYYLEEIPLEIGDIPTLELIQIKGCMHSAAESVRRIQKEQKDEGNYHLKIDISLERKY